MKELTVTNLYGLRGTITHRTDANVLVVTGDNGAGKSSFVEAFAHIFCHKAAKGAPDPVHHGEDAAEAVFVDDDGLSFRRKWSGGKMSAVEIRAADGARFAKPGDILAEKLGAVTVDVSGFLLMDEKARRDLILSKSRLAEGTDFSSLNRAVADAEANRTDVNREAARLKAAAASLPRPGDGVPDVEVSAGELIEQIQAADALRAENDRQVRLLGEMEGELIALEQKIELLRAAVKAQREAVDVLRMPADTDALRAQLSEVEETNRAVRDKRAWLKALADAAEGKAAADVAEQKVQAARQAKAEALKAAEFPHPAISIDDDENITVHGVPWPNVNAGERLLTALAVAIAGVPADGGLRLVILKEGDWMDAKTLARANDMLTERGFFALVDRGRPDMPSEVGIDVLELAGGQRA